MHTFSVLCYWDSVSTTCTTHSYPQHDRQVEEIRDFRHARSVSFVFLLSVENENVKSPQFLLTWIYTGSWKVKEWKKKKEKDLLNNKSPGR